jgi:hypothetical protein
VTGSLNLRKKKGPAQPHRPFLCFWLSELLQLDDDDRGGSAVLVNEDQPCSIRDSDRARTDVSRAGSIIAGRTQVGNDHSNAVD